MQSSDMQNWVKIKLSPNSHSQSPPHLQKRLTSFKLKQDWPSVFLSNSLSDTEEQAGLETIDRIQPHYLINEKTKVQVVKEQKQNRIPRSPLPKV